MIIYQENAKNFMGGKYDKHFRHAGINYPVTVDYQNDKWYLVDRTGVYFMLPIQSEKVGYYTTDFCDVDYEVEIKSLDK